MKLRLATFNLENLDDGPDLDPPLAARIEVLRPQLLRVDADILCLQEVNGQKPPGASRRTLAALDRLLDHTPLSGFYRATTHSTGRHASRPWVSQVHNLVVLSRWPITAASELSGALVQPPRHKRLDGSVPLEALPWDRPLLHVTVALPEGRNLDLVNLHLRAPLAATLPGSRGKEGPFSWSNVPAWAEGFYVSALKRAGQALEARLLVDSLFDRDPDALVAVAGDLNAEDRETPLRLLAAETTDTGNGTLAHRCLVPLSRSIPLDSRYSTVHGGRRIMVDHILASRALLAGLQRVEAHNETLTDEARVFSGVRHSTESSHAPVAATFEI